MSSWFVIGISGVSCAGKTSLSQNVGDFLSHGAFLADPQISHWNADFRILELRQRLANCRFQIGSVKVIHQDDYFLPESCQEDIELLNHKNWELITALDMPRMCNDIENTLRSELSDESQQHNIINVLIVEGFTIFENSFIQELSSLKFHMHLPYEMCFARRKRRVYNPADVVGYFEMCVWPQYEKYFRERIKERTDIRLLNGELPRIELNLYVLNMIGKIFKF